MAQLLCVFASLREKNSSSSYIPALDWRPLRDQVVTSRWIEAAYFCLVTIDASEGAVLVERQQLFVQILPQTILVVTLSTRRYRHIRFQSAQRR